MLPPPDSPTGKSCGAVLGKGRWSNQARPSGKKPATEWILVVSDGFLGRSFPGGWMGAVWRAWICPRRGEPIINRLCPPAAAISSARLAPACPLTSAKSQVGRLSLGKGSFRQPATVQPLLIPIQQLADVGDAIHLDPWTSAPSAALACGKKKNPAQSCCLAPSTSGSAPLIRRLTG